MPAGIDLSIFTFRFVTSSSIFSPHHVDLSKFFTFKAEYDAFMASADRPTKLGGKPASPPIEMQMKWIACKWQTLTPELIARSFVACAIIETEGSEDDAIHFFKTHGPSPARRALLDAARPDR